MTIEELVNKVTPRIAIGDFDSALTQLLRLMMGEGEEIVSYYYKAGKFTYDEGSIKMDQPDTLCILTKDRIYKIDIQIEDEDQQAFQAESHPLADITSYNIDAAIMRDSFEGSSWLALRSFSLTFQNGKRIELYCDKTTESNPLQEFAISVLQQIR